MFERGKERSWHIDLHQKLSKDEREQCTIMYMYMTYIVALVWESQGRVAMVSLKLWRSSNLSTSSIFSPECVYHFRLHVVEEQPSKPV